MFIDSACLRAEIKLCDPMAFFDCLAFEGGTKPATVVLFQEEEGAQTMFDACRRVGFDTKGIQRVHHI